MTTTYAPKHPRYLDEADVRAELTRVFDICGSCRSCVDLCMSFPTLFDMLDQHSRSSARPDAGLLTPAEQDQVVDRCVQCAACHAQCPYTPELHEWAVDVPRLLLRAKAMQHRVGIGSMRSRLRDRLAGHPKLVARLAIVMPQTAGRMAGATFAAQRFSTWFSGRTPVSTTGGRASVTVLPTCRVEYHEPVVGIDLVERFDADGIGCAISDAGCCGAPWLFSGDIDRFAGVAARNVATLAAEVRRGTDIVVPDTSCRNVVRSGYVDHAGGADAELVATHTFEPSSYLATHRAP